MISGACFIIPAILGFRKRKKCKEALATSALATTSVWFHGTYSTISNIIDRTYAHVFSIYFITKSCIRFLFYRTRTDCLTFTCSMGATMCYFIECMYYPQIINIPLHMGLHTYAILALTTHMITE